jgi:phenylalanyl-tRNA synthetase beta chain
MPATASRCRSSAARRTRAQAWSAPSRAPGTYVPGIDVTLSVGNIRGVESRGMMCSEKELDMSDNHDGIIDLPADAPVGTSFASYAGLDDPVIEINLTPNRPDCTSIYGIARDLAASGLGTLKQHAKPDLQDEGETPVKVKLNSAMTIALCPGFALRLVRGVKNGPSPRWMQQRLIAIGLRPINALVDITNYMTFDQGRPMHVFDAAKVKGNLTVRRALPGRDGAGARPARIHADAGQCRDRRRQRRRVHRRRHGRRAFGLRREHHRRADRIGPLGPDEHRQDRPLARHHHRCALPLRARRRSGIHGTWASSARPNWCWNCAAAPQPRQMSSATRATPAEGRRLPDLGSQAPDGPRCVVGGKREILTRLGFGVKGSGERVSVAVPSWRPDVDGKADLVEEVMRIHGVDNIKPAPLESLRRSTAAS